MISESDIALLAKATAAAKPPPESLAHRDEFIVYLLKHGATVAEIVQHTGLTRGRIYQIKDAAKPTP